jgi:predicted MFS family arabinose efflux permease
MTQAAFDPNTRRARWSAILLGVIGVQVFIVQPGFVQGLVEILGFSQREAGLIAAAEMLGTALTATAMTVLAAKLDWRRYLLAGCLLAVAGNLISVFMTSANYFGAARFLAGLGLGALVSLSWAAVGLTRNPDREFALYLTWVLVYGAAGLLAMPVLFGAFGITGFLLLMAAFAATGLAVVRFAPPSGDSRGEPNPDAVEMPVAAKSMALFGVLAYNVAQGVMWTYLFLIGTQAGFGEQPVANALTLSQVVAIAGALTSYFLGNRIGRNLPLFCGIVAGGFSLIPLTGAFSLGTFTAAVVAFNFLWNMVLPYMLASLASYDRRGLMVVHAVAMQMIGLGVGPALGAAAVLPGNFDRVIAASISCFALSLVALAVASLRHAVLRERAK